MDNQPDPSIPPGTTREITRFRAVLERAVADRIISSEQADAILTAEAARTTARAGRVPVFVEALAYLGGLLVMAGSAALLNRFWDTFPTAARVGLFGGVAVVLSASVYGIPEGRDPALERLTWFLWALASGALAVAVGLFGADVLDAAPESVALLVGIAVAAHSGLRWGLGDRPLQHLICLGGLVAALTGAAATVDGDAVVGLAVWLLGAGWIVAGSKGLLPPRLLALVAGSIVVLLSPAPLRSWSPRAASLLGLASAAALLIMGIRRRDFSLTLTGALGTLLYLPMTVAEFFGETVAVPLAIILSGVILLALALRTFRRGRPSRPGAT